MQSKTRSSGLSLIIVIASRASEKPLLEATLDFNHFIQSGRRTDSS